jgi:uncharacterized low-complexity protein
MARSVYAASSLSDAGQCGEARCGRHDFVDRRVQIDVSGV